MSFIINPKRFGRAIKYTKATGGIISYYTDGITTWKIHRFYGDETPSFTQKGDDDRLLISMAGGGGSGGSTGATGGGGGAGGLLKLITTVTLGTFPIAIGIGGARVNGMIGNNGGDTIFFGYTAQGGGAGGSSSPGNNGGSGGGGSRLNPGGSGIPGQGKDGGAGNNAVGAGGGGGAGAPGGDFGGDGGAGALSNIPGDTAYYCAGGGGASGVAQTFGGLGGGGNGAGGGFNATDAQDGTGSGGGGGLGNSGKGSDGFVFFAYPCDPRENAPVLRLAIPSLLDQSGNGYHSVLGASLPVGFTAPTIDGSNNLVFNGLQAVKLHGAFEIGAMNNHTEFMVIYTDTPEVTQALLNLGTEYRCGLGIFAETRNTNHWVNACGTCRDEALITSEPVYGKSLPKLHKGYNVIGWSCSDTGSYMYLNGLVTTFTPNNPYSTSTLSGWLGAFAGGTLDNAYQVPAYFTLPAGSTIDVFNFAKTPAQLQAYGDGIIQNMGIKLFTFRGDSNSAGYQVSSNAASYTNQLMDFLINSTPDKWAACNISIGGMSLQTSSSIAPLDGSTVPFKITASVNINVLRPVGAANYQLVFLGINDFLSGRTLSQAQSYFTTLLTYLTSQGWTRKFVFTPPSASDLTTGEESDRQAFISWLPAQQASLGFVLVDICSISGLDVQPVSVPNTYYSDNAHYTDYAHSLISNYAAMVIGPNL